MPRGKGGGPRRDPVPTDSPSKTGVRLKDAVALAGSQYVALGIGFLTSVLAARWLGPAQLGLAAILLGLPDLVWSFSSLKPATVITRYLSTFRAQEDWESVQAVKNIGYGVDLATALLVLAVVAVTAPIVLPSIYGVTSAESWLSVAYAGTFVAAALGGTSQALMNSWGAFTRMGAFSVLERGFSLLLLTLFVGIGLKASAVVFSNGIGQACGAAASTWAAHRLLRDLPRGQVRIKRFLKSRPQLWMEMRRLLGWNYLLVTFTGLGVQAPILFAGAIGSAQDAGYLRICFTFVAAFALVETSLAKVVFPELSVLAGQQRWEEVNAKTSQWTRRIGIWGVVLTLAGAVTVPLALTFIVGPEYRPMRLGLAILLASGAMQALLFWLNPLYFGAGLVRQFTVRYGFGTIVGLLAMLVLTEFYGFTGSTLGLGLGRVLSVGLIYLGRPRSPTDTSSAQEIETEYLARLPNGPNAV
jgi:O-antigen/teichoic acid export membrane protein